MSDKTLQEKLQRAYHAMLENVENLIEKESKSIREAIYNAEDKLTEWEELSKEEVEKVSDEVKRDLTSLSETFIGAKAAFKEQLILDKRYLAQATWDKLSSIANKSTLQLIQFKENLEENVREIDQDAHAVTHHEHQQWHNDHALWLDEIIEWEKTNEKAKEKIETIRVMLNQQTQALEEHKQSIQSHGAMAQEHEHALTEVERDPSSQVARERDEKQDLLHAQEQRVHQQQAAFHADIKNHHRKTLALINALHKEVQLFAEI